MRRLALVLTLVLALPVAARAQEFYRLYEQGVSAFNARRFDEARQKLEAAKAKSPKQGPRIFFYGLRYDEYVPDYYLGLIALEEQRLNEALQLLEGVESGKFLRSGDRSKNDRLAQALGSVRQQLARAKEPATPQWQTDFQRAMAAGEQALREKRFADARGAATTARASARDARTQGELAGLERRIRADESAAMAEQARAAITAGNEAAAQGHIERLAGYNPQHPGLDQLRSDLGELRRRREADDIAGRARQALGQRDPAAAAQEIARLAGVSPNHSALPGLRSELGRLEASREVKPVGPTGPTNPLPTTNADAERLRQAERDALRLFLRGDYDVARQRLQAFGPDPSPRMQLYLASSQAALALLRKDEALAAEARRTYSRLRPHAATFEPDFRYISPAVRRVLNGGAL